MIAAIPMGWELVGRLYLALGSGIVAVSVDVREVAESMVGGWDGGLMTFFRAKHSSSSPRERYVPSSSAAAASCYPEFYI